MVDPASGRIKVANIPCIDGRRLADDLAAALGRPVLVTNDADCFALAEAAIGAGRGHRVVFGIILGTGVGGGVVVDGRLVEGAGGFAGEWGHGPILARQVGDPPVDIPWFACGCGQSGCVDTIGGARGMERLHHHLTGATMKSRAIMDAWRAGEPQAVRTFDCYIELVAQPLAFAVNLLGADIVPVGGGLGTETEMIAILDRAVRQSILRDTAEPLVVPGAVRRQSGLHRRGAASPRSARVSRRILEICVDSAERARGGHCRRRRPHRALLGAGARRPDAAEEPDARPRPRHRSRSMR